MIRMQNGSLKGNIKFDKARLMIAFNPLRSKGLEIKRKLDLFKDLDVDSFSIESFAHRPHTIKVEKVENGYTLSLTKTIQVPLKPHEYAKLEEFLIKMADECIIDSSTLVSSDSSSQLLNNGNETPRST